VARRPASWLYGLFLLAVVVGSAALLAWYSDWPIAVVPVVLYLLYAGRTVDHWGAAPIDEFLLPEVWVVPLVAGCLLARKRRQWWLAAALAAAAVLVRELAVLLVLGGLLAAVVERKPRAPWVAALAVSAAGYAAHVQVASGYTSSIGNEAPLWGSASFPWSMLRMMDWPIPGPLVIGGAIWAVAVVWCWRRGDLLFLGPYLALALTGLVVERPYWGLMFAAFTVFFTAEALADYVTRRLLRESPQPTGSLATSSIGGSATASGGSGSS